MREQLCVIREAILLSSSDIQGQQVAALPTENNAELSHQSEKSLKLQIEEYSNA